MGGDVVGGWVQWEEVLILSPCSVSALHFYLPPISSFLNSVRLVHTQKNHVNFLRKLVKAKCIVYSFFGSLRWFNPLFLFKFSFDFEHFSI